MGKQRQRDRFLMFEKRIFSNDFVSGDFILSDSEKLYEQNKNKLGDSWFYTDNKISYDLNSEGFRAPRFDMVSWRKTIAVFGCSYVFGTGLPESHTISGRINLKTNHDVINLGVEGLSNYGILYNVTQFKKKYNPKICIILWTDSSRITYQTKKKDYFITAWEASTGKMKELVPDIEPGYMTGNDIQQKDMFYQDIANLIPDVYTMNHWEIDTMGLCKEHFNVADTKKLDMQLVNRYLARDIGWSRLHKCYFAHPGLEITQMYADKIWNSLPKTLRMELK